MKGSVASVSVSGAGSRGVTLRTRGIALLSFLIVEFGLGGALSTFGSPYPTVYLAAHVLVAISLVGFSAYATVVAFRRQDAGPRAAALTTLVGALGATVGGAAFLTVGGPSDLDAMVVLGLVAVLGAVLLIAFGVV